MTNKSLSLFVFAILSFAILASFASATITINPSTITLNQFGDSQSFTITNNNPSSPTTINSLTSQTITDKNGRTAAIIFVNPSPLTIPASTTSAPFTANITNMQSNFAIGTTSLTYNITTSDLSVSAPLTINLGNTVCGFKDNSHLSISLDSTHVVNGGFGDDTNWYPLDNIEAKVKVSNEDTGNSIRSVVVKWELYDTLNQKKIKSGSENSFSLGSGNDKTVTIDFQLDDVNSLGNGGNNYILYVWATGNDQADSGNSTCSSDNSGQINIDMSDNFVVVDQNSLSTPITASCGGQVQVTGTVWNIGDTDENNVYIIASSTQLGISQRIDVGDLNQGDSKDLSFNLNIPDMTIPKGTYALKLSVYDDNNNIFENNNNDKSESQVLLNFNDTCTSVPKVSVAAALTSAAKAGNEVDVTATIANTGSTTKTFTLSLGGYSTWASSATLSQSSITLASGASQDVTIKLQSNKDSSGDQQFNIIVNDGNSLSSQPVKISVTAASTFPSITGFFSNLSGGNNSWYIWGIVALNVILVIIIIAVAVRVVKKK
jgi:hypothetical protein